jgi:hypothetical protein
VRLAARGARETLTGGTAPVEDAEEARHLKRQARRVFGESAAVAVLVTGLVLLARGVFGT